MAPKIKVDQIQTADGTGTIALQNQLSGMTSASMPTGSVLQVVSDSHYHPTSHASTSSTSFVDSNLSATITPTSTSSKIMVLVTMGAQSPSSGRGIFNAVRGSTELDGNGWCGQEESAGNYNYGSWGANWIDTPSTTSATIYKVQVKATAGTFYYHHAKYISSLILMEIAG